MTALAATSSDIWDSEFRKGVLANLKKTSWRPELEIDASRGFRVLPQGVLPGYADIRRVVVKLFNERLQDDGSVKQLYQSKVKANPKGYMQSVLIPQDFVDYPELLSVALDPAVLAAVGDYLGTLPVLRLMQVFWTPPHSSGTLDGSQFFHYDHDDDKEVKLFFYIDDMDEEGGPFTFLDRQASARVTAGLQPFKSRRYHDDDIFGRAKPDEVLRFTGGAGTGAFVDTSNCLHFGARVSDKGRLLVKHVFLRPESNVMHAGRIVMSDIEGLDLDETQKLVVAMPPWVKLPA